MATILELNNQQKLSYLSAYHCIGRSDTNVDSVIRAPEISRMHAIIQWTDEHWIIRDISSNGTWINNEKLIKEQQHKIRIGDEISFAQQGYYGFIVQELSPPKNMLLAVDQSGIIISENAIMLSDNNLLPSEQQPEISLFYVQSKNQWYKEFINDVEGRAYPVANLERLHFANRDWQLKLNNLSENTIKLVKPKLLAHQIKYRFNLSQDEENTELNIIVDDKKLCLSNKAHHYLTLSLARHRDDDAKKGIDEYDQGWRLPEMLAKELGCEITLFNTHVCRAKKQFREMLGGACDGDILIERKGKNIRFSGTYYRIYKGRELIVNRGQDKVALTVLHG